MMTLRATIALLFALAPTSALAQSAIPEDDDGYCDFVKGTASANAATLVAPELFWQFGHIEQPTFVATPVEPSNLRMIAGVRYSLTNIYAGVVTKARADADCRRHKVQQALQGAIDSLSGLDEALRAIPRRHALSAQVKVLDQAL